MPPLATIGAAPDLAPFYDAGCTAAYPRLAKNLAMKIGGHNVPDTIHWAQWSMLVPDTRAAHRVLAKDMADLARAIGGEADLLRAELRDMGIDHGILETVRGIIDTRASHVLRIVEKV